MCLDTSRNIYIVLQLFALYATKSDVSLMLFAHFDFNSNRYYFHVCIKKTTTWNVLKMFSCSLFYHMHGIYAYFWFSGNTFTELSENHQDGADFAKENFTFGSRSNKCQQRAQLFQWIWRLWMLLKNFQKVWFEDAWEITFQSLLKLATQRKFHS